ncbi:MAG: inosine/xanthosine triphosphatase [Minisyncoccia bacterium]
MQKLVVVVGTESALKLRAVEAALRVFGLQADVVPCKVEAWVGIQPTTKHETMCGACTRSLQVMQLNPEADFCIGIENGLTCEDDSWFDFPYVHIRSRAGNESSASGATFFIPEWMVTRTLGRKTDLGEIVRELARGSEKDVQDYLSNGSVLREQIISQAVYCAFAPLLNSTRYQEV